MHALLFDLGGTYLRAGITGPDGTLANTAKTRIRSIADGLAEDAIWPGVATRILDYAMEQRSSLPPNAPVVISFPGPVTNRRRVLQAPTVAGGSTKVFDLAAAVEQGTGRRVLLLNDVSAAAWRLAETTTARRFMVVTVSSGVGSKIFDRCHPSGVLDQPAYSGEIGHVVVDDSSSAPVCDCGGRGHLGAIASGRGIERCARRRAAVQRREFEASKTKCDFGATPQTLNNEEHLAPAVLAGDSWALRIVSDCTRPLARVLLSVAMAAGLDRVFLIGGFAQALGNRYVEIMRDLAIEVSRYEPVREQLDSLFEMGLHEQETCLEGCAAFLRHTRTAL